MFSECFSPRVDKSQDCVVKVFKGVFFFVDGLMFCSKMPFQPFPNGQILDSSKKKEFADDNFKVDENDRKFSKW